MSGPMNARVGPRIITIDSGYVLPEFAAAYLVVAGEGDAREACFVETSTARAVPILFQALVREGLRPDQVKYVIVTHVHLDHAGGAGALLGLLPNARLLVHPRGRRHLIDPTRLEAAVRQVYGDSRFDQFYGSLTAIPEARVEAIEDGETRRLGGQTLRFFHVRGHANHHFCVELTEAKRVFTGDAYGLCYPEVSLRLHESGLEAGVEWGLVSTSPSDFDGPEARASLSRILERKPVAVYPTHFGELSRPERVQSFLVEQLEHAEEWVREIRLSSRQSPDAETLSRLQGQWKTLIEAQWKRAGVRLSEPRVSACWEILAMDLELNAQGLLAASTRKA